MAETTEDLAANNEAIIAAMNAQHALEEKGNRNYDGEEKRYKVWIDKTDPGRTKFGLPPNKYISTQGLISYFLEVQAGRCVQGRTAKKSIYALNKLAVKEEATHVLGEKSGTFSIELGPAAAAISAALKSIQRSYSLKRRAEDTSCPQRILPTNIISQRDQSLVLSKVLSRHDSTWADTASTWSTAANTLIRFESIKRVRLNRLKIIKDLPPHGIETPHDTQSWETANQNKTDGRILGIVIPTSDQLKKNTLELRAEIVGGYRHKRYERCYHGILGFLLLERLNDGQAVSFLEADSVPEGSVHWTQLPIFHYKYDAANKAFKRARELAEVDKWLKTTHMRLVFKPCFILCILYFFVLQSYRLTTNRKAGSVFCTAQGLTGQQVKSLTKHKQDVFDKDYFCELCIQVMTTIAGFIPDNENDRYFVPRSSIGLPGNVPPDDIAKLLFPDLNRWRNEYNSENGDKTNSSKEFLFSVIVYLAEVICQDGVLWLKNHKKNPAVAELKRLLDGRTGVENYATWAQRKFLDIQRRVKNIQDNRIEMRDLRENLVSGIEETVVAQRKLTSSIQEMLQLNATLRSELANRPLLNMPQEEEQQNAVSIYFLLILYDCCLTVSHLRIRGLLN